MEWGCQSQYTLRLAPLVVHGETEIALHVCMRLCHKHTCDGIAVGLHSIIHAGGSQIETNRPNEKERTPTTGAQYKYDAAKRSYWYEPKPICIVTAHTVPTTVRVTARPLLVLFPLRQLDNS